MDTALYFQSWAQAFAASFQNVIYKILAYLPQIVGALIVFVLGLILARALQRLTVRIIEYSRVRSFVNHSGIQQEVSRLGVSGTIADWVGSLVKWVIIIITLLAVSDILHIEPLSNFINQVILYIPRVIVAVIILGLGFVGGRLLHDIVERAAGSAQSTARSAGVLGAVAKWSVVIFSIMAALLQLGIATSLIQILFTGLVAMIAIAGGIAFGWGGREKAQQLLNRVNQEFQKG